MAPILALLPAPSALATGAMIQGISGVAQTHQMSRPKVRRDITGEVLAALPGLRRKQLWRVRQVTREEGGTSEGGCAKRVARRPARLVSRGEARANHEHPPPGPLESWS